VFVVGVWHFNIAPDHDGEGNGGSTLSTYQSFILTTLSWILPPQHAFIQEILSMITSSNQDASNEVCSCKKLLVIQN